LSVTGGRRAGSGFYEGEGGGESSASTRTLSLQTDYRIKWHDRGRWTPTRRARSRMRQCGSVSSGGRSGDCFGRGGRGPPRLCNPRKKKSQAQNVGRHPPHNELRRYPGVVFGAAGVEIIVNRVSRGPGKEGCAQPGVIGASSREASTHEGGLLWLRRKRGGGYLRNSKTSNTWTG